MNLFRKLAASIAPRREFRGADNARAYAIGDVHGRLDLLDGLLARIHADAAARPAVPTYLVMLGDLIDRGPDSAGVIERVRTLGPQSGFTKTVCLMGNHEEIFLRALDGEPGVAYDWFTFGGDAFVESYGLNPHQLGALEEPQIAEALKTAIPASHIAFVRGFGDTLRFGDYLFVHAGIRPGVPVEEQQPRDLRWIRSPFLQDSHDHGVLVVHGHTVTDAVEERANRIGIDTGAYQSGALTALAVEGDERWYLSTGGAAASGLR